MRYGTSYFINQAAAIRYYRDQGYDADAIGQKFADGEIHTGKPPVKSGQRVLLDRTEGRYFIEEV